MALLLVYGIASKGFPVILLLPPYCCSVFFNITGIAITRLLTIKFLKLLWFRRKLSIIIYGRFTHDLFIKFWIIFFNLFYQKRNHQLHFLAAPVMEAQSSVKCIFFKSKAGPYFLVFGS